MISEKSKKQEEKKGEESKGKNVDGRGDAAKDKKKPARYQVTKGPNSIKKKPKAGKEKVDDDNEEIEIEILKEAQTEAGEGRALRPKKTLF